MSGTRGVRFALRAFRHRDFRIFWVGALASNTGTWLSNLAAPYLLFQLTHSAVWASLATVGQILPGAVLGAWGGSLADRHDRRRLLLVTQGGMAAAAVALWLLCLTSHATPWAILVTLAAGSLFYGTNGPVWQSFTNDLIPREDLGSAVTLNSLQFNAARAIGPALAGGIIALLSTTWAFGLNALSFGCVLVALACIRTHARSAAVAPANVLRDFSSAVRYIRRQPGIQVAIGLSLLVGFFGNPIFTFTVVFAGDVLHVGAIGLGLMNASIGLGCLLVSPLIAGGLPSLTFGRLTRVALPLFGVAIGGFALAPSLLPAIALLVLTGACFMTVQACANSAIQLIVAAPMRGRVIGVRLVFFTGVIPIGSLVQGWVADLLGARVAELAAGSALLLAGLLLSVADRGRRLRRLDDPNDTGESTPDASGGPGGPSAVPHCGTAASLPR